MIPKPDKRNLSDPGAWRPISLLPCLSKGLERVLARRLAYQAIASGILPETLAGALPKRSAIDIVASLVFDLEDLAFRKKLVATLVTMDAKGAFDAVLRGRLIKRLREQGWPTYLIRWVDSFMTERMARVRFASTTTEAVELLCGLPQGSPISPILYLLYISSIYNLAGADARYGYADDTAMLFVGKTLKETSQRAAAAIEDMETWGRTSAITFDPRKTEIMHFSKRRRREEIPDIQHGERTIAVLNSIRWLGVYLDKTLFFKAHIQH
ncbi:hypothetical protein VHEMI10763 [[Torrubiella] hemipterigena]|uniref:Reverse transcriptase domain-containing protein n=1 Tax=[Torrubiella] hemipterigena TaxID=1531966 RepID=A0A0A1TJJ6_9HYPO|nr:hypothetical protein VHEMI10763 [[Torrubiella] hemipterigena]